MPPMSRNVMTLAVLVTLSGIFISQALSVGIPITGIDDAAITMSYAHNIANGHGYVYNVGGERVEGATSFLWVGILTLAFLASDDPYPIILSVAGVLTFIAIWSALGIAQTLSEVAGVSPLMTSLFAGAAILGAPGFFMWSTWSQMEVGLWSALILLLINRLTFALATYDQPGRVHRSVLIVAALLPLVRPEGIAVAIGLIAVTGLVAMDRWKMLLAPILVALGSFLALLVFRLLYFGYPWPNTFYAKVSADRLQTFVDGAKYVLSFALQMPFAEMFIALWVLATLWALLTRWESGRCFVPSIAAVAGIFLTYSALGGDHFVLWRFLEPVIPLLPIAASIAAAYVCTRVSETTPGHILAKMTISGAAFLSIILPGWAFYHQERFDVIKEFRIAERGIAFGEALDDVVPRPVIGVGPAGGVALAYNGEILDLLGLNWTEMAHANPVKQGTRNLASFDRAVFWRHQPDVVAEFKRSCIDGGFELWSAADYYKGLYWSEKFRQVYQPVLFQKNDGCWPIFVEKKWLEQVDAAQFVSIGWDKVILN